MSPFEVPVYINLVPFIVMKTTLTIESPLMAYIIADGFMG